MKWFSVRGFTKANLLFLGLNLLIISFSSQTRAAEFTNLYRGARAQAMGNAFTAVADDEQAIFYNPAGLAGIQKFSFNVANVVADFSNEMTTSYSQLNDALGGGNIAGLNALLGKNLYARVQGTSSVVVPGFGLAAIYDNQGSIRLQNRSYPTGAIGNQSTYGAQMAFGTRIIKLKKNKGEIRFGLGGKVLNRGGGYAQLSLNQLMTADTSSILNRIKAPTTMGYGLDTGFQLVYRLKKKITLLSGLAFTDIGNTSFSSEVNPIYSNLTFGTALRFSSGDAVTTLSYDYAHILDSADWKKKTHLGLEIKVPLFRLYGGLNQFNVTYGAGIDLWLISLMYLSYAEEQGVLVGNNPERRQMVQLSFKLEL